MGKNDITINSIYWKMENGKTRAREKNTNKLKKEEGRKRKRLYSENEVYDCQNTFVGKNCC